MDRIGQIQKSKSYSPDFVINAAAKLFGITRKEILQYNRTWLVASARRHAMAYMRLSQGLPFEKIGGIFNRHHTSVMTAIRHAEEEPELLDAMIRQVEGLE